MRRFKASVNSVEDPESRRRRDRRVPLWLATSGSSQLGIEELELGADLVFAGLESEPFSFLNTDT